MAGEALRKVTSGQRLVIPAAAYNSFVEAAMDLHARRQETGRAAEASRPQHTMVLVRNDSGADRGRFDVLGVDSSIFTPTDNLDEFKNHVALAGVTPIAAAHTGRFVVLLEPVKDGEIGRALAAGVSPARVNVIDPAHGFADVANGNPAHLASGPAGVATILWKEPGTGQKWAVVRLPAGGGVGGGPDPGDSVPVIDATAGTAGTGTDYALDTRVSGLLLRGNPADKEVAGVGDASLEFTAEAGGTRRGLQVRIDEYADITLEVTEYGLRVKLKADAGLGADNDGVFVIAGPGVLVDVNGVKIDLGHGLHLVGNKVQVKPGTNVTVDENGVHAAGGGGPSPYDGVPESIGGPGSPGTSVLYARGNHKHPSTIEGMSNWHVPGDPNAGKIFAVMK